MTTPSLKKAKSLLLEGGNSLALVRGEESACSSLSGILPVFEMLREHPRLVRGGSAADKVMGKAAALLWIYGGIREVYADVGSGYAKAALEQAGIPFEFRTVIPYIQNRAGTDLCPMERLVLEIDDPDRAYAALYGRIFGDGNQK